jgi:hypothetical protein
MKRITELPKLPKNAEVECLAANKHGSDLLSGANAI